VRGRFVNWFGEQKGARVNGVFLVRTLHYRAERLEVAIRNVVLREGGLLIGLVKKCEVLKAIL
jgi:hypothetical protein